MLHSGHVAISGQQSKDAELLCRLTKQPTSRPCSLQLRRGFCCGGACMSHSLMLPSPEADARTFSLASLHAQSHRPSMVSNAAMGCRPCGVTCTGMRLPLRLPHSSLVQCCQATSCPDAWTGRAGCIGPGDTHPQDQLLAIPDDAVILRCGDSDEVSYKWREPDGTRVELRLVGQHPAGGERSQLYC